VPSEPTSASEEEAVGAGEALGSGAGLLGVCSVPALLLPGEVPTPRPAATAPPTRPSTSRPPAKSAACAEANFRSSSTTAPGSRARLNRVRAVTLLAETSSTMAANESSQEANRSKSGRSFVMGLTFMLVMSSTHTTSGISDSLNRCESAKQPPTRSGLREDT